MKKIIIVGASSGIGKELAKIWAARGHRVGITGRRTMLLNQLASENPERFVVETFDVMATKRVFHIQSLIKKLGGLDILVYNSGYGETSESIDPTISKTTVETNVNGFIEIVDFGFNYFVSQGHGQLVNTSSIGSNRGNSFAPAYSASKAFQSIYFEGLHMKLKKMKSAVSVTDIQPGFVDTKMAKGNKRFWVASPQKAALQIAGAIDRKKWRAYITHRWWLIAKLMKWMPNVFYHRFG
jgi:short-subunit dehydrogenase